MPVHELHVKGLQLWETGELKRDRPCCWKPLIHGHQYRDSRMDPLLHSSESSSICWPTACLHRRLGLGNCLSLHALPDDVLLSGMHPPLRAKMDVHPLSPIQKLALFRGIKN